MCFLYTVLSWLYLRKVASTCYDSDAGEIYAKKLANFVEKRLKSERAASVSFIHKYSRLNFECSFLFNILLNARSYCNLIFLKRVKRHV